MPMKPNVESQTIRREEQLSKELLLVSGLGLEPRWLLNRLQITYLNSKSSAARF